MSKIEDQIIELQTKLAYQEDATQRLNDVIYRQQQQIDHLENMSTALLQRIKVLVEVGATEPEVEERPPHY